MEKLVANKGFEELQQFHPEAVSCEVNDLMIQMLGFYTDSEEFQVEDKREDGSSVVRVLMDVNYGGKKPYYQPYQEIEYCNDTVIRVSSEGGGNWYGYDQENNEIYMGTDRTSNGNAQWHSVRCTISPQSQLLEEVTRIQVHTDLAVEYHPVMRDDILGFQSAKVSLHQYLPLSPEDVHKFLPEGRFIALNDLLISVLDPYRSNRICKERVPKIHYIDTFPKFVCADVGHHSKDFVTTLDRDKDKVYGFAHPLKDDPNGWLVFTRFRDGESAKGRALIVTVDRKSVQVQDIEGIPTINVQVSVDGEPFQLAIPEIRGRWEEATEVNLAKALSTHTDDEGMLRVFRQITDEELAVSIEQGYYFGDMLNAAMGEYHGKYYSEDGDDV